MFKKSMLALALLSISPILYAQTTSSSCGDPNLKLVLDKIIAPLVNNKTVPSAEVGVYENGTVCYFSYGQTLIGGKLAAPDQHTLFEIGSNTKVFTATLLAVAAERHLLRLDDPVDNSKYLPSWIEMNPKAKNVTFRQLANFSSGMPRMPAEFILPSILGYPVEKLNIINYTKADFSSFLKSWYPMGSLPAKWDYSNASYGFLGYLLTNIYNHNDNYETLVEQVITGPLHMSDTVINPNDSQQQQLAQPYNVRLFFKTKAPNWPPSVFEAAGNLKSTAQDMLIFLQANLGVKKIGNISVSSELLTAMQSTQKVDFLFDFRLQQYGQALAWMTNLPSSGHDEIIYKNGGTAGFSSFMGLDRKKHLALVLLTNGGSLRTVRIAGDVTDAGIKALYAIPAANN